MDLSENTKDGTTESAFGLTKETPYVLRQIGNWATEVNFNSQKAHTKPMGFSNLGPGPNVSANQTDSLSKILTPSKKSNELTPLSPNPTIQD